MKSRVEPITFFKSNAKILQAYVFKYYQEYHREEKYPCSGHFFQENLWMTLVSQFFCINHSQRVCMFVCLFVSVLLCMCVCVCPCLCVCLCVTPIYALINKLNLIQAEVSCFFIQMQLSFAAFSWGIYHVHLRRHCFYVKDRDINFIAYFYVKNIKYS